MSEERIVLEGILRELYDNDDFVNGIIFCCHGEEGIIEMLKYISYCYSHNIPVDHDSVMWLSVAMQKEYERKIQKDEFIPVKCD